MNSPGSTIVVVEGWLNRCERGFDEVERESRLTDLVGERWPCCREQAQGTRLGGAEPRTKYCHEQRAGEAGSA